MFRKLSLSNNGYLTITTLISAGVLAGCKYCIPVLMTLLSIPVIRLLIRAFSGTGSDNNGLPAKG